MNLRTVPSALITWVRRLRQKAALINVKRKRKKEGL